MKTFLVLFLLCITTVVYAADVDVDVDTNNIMDAAFGGTNIDTSASTGIPQVTGGTWSIDADGSTLTAVDAITGDSATAFFDAGIIEITYGGTGVADPTDHALLVGSGAAAMTELAVGASTECW